MAAKTYKITTATARARLSVRPDPYFTRVENRLAVGVHRGPSGDSWRARYQRPDGSKTYKALGDADTASLPANGVSVLDFDQAAQAAREWRNAFLQNEGLTVAERTTVQDVIDAHIRYLYQERAETTAYSAERRMMKHLSPTMAKTKIATLTTNMIEDWHRSLVPTGRRGDRRRAARSSANECLTVLRAALNRRVKSDWGIRDDIWRRVKPFETVAKSRQIFLKEAEGRQLVDSCEDKPLRDLIEVALLTGSRFGELAQAEVRDFDLDAAIWSVARSKTGPREQVLTQTAVMVLRRIVGGKQKTDLVFIRSDGMAWNNHRIRFPFSRAIKAAGLDEAATFYCLRHSYVSWSLKRGMQAQVLAENIGTSIRMLERFYAKFLREDRRAMLEGAASDFAADSAKVVRLAEGGRQ